MRPMTIVAAEGSVLRAYGSGLFVGLAFVVAAVVAIVILVFCGVGYLFGRLFL